MHRCIQLLWRLLILRWSHWFFLLRWILKHNLRYYLILVVNAIIWVNIYWNFIWVNIYWNFVWIYLSRAIKVVLKRWRLSAERVEWKRLANLILMCYLLLDFWTLDELALDVQLLSDLILFNLFFYFLFLIYGVGINVFLLLLLFLVLCSFRFLLTLSGFLFDFL